MTDRNNIVVVSTEDRHYYVQPHTAQRKTGTYEIEEEVDSGVTTTFNWDNVISVNKLTDEEMAAVLSEEYKMEISADELEEYA
jgi:hypothetical protein